MENMKYLVIACNIMKDELLLFQTNGISFIFLEQSLHRTPQKMKPIIQEEIDKAAEQDWDYIILSYGLCSNGILGVKSNRHPIVIPRVHDCIALFLGSWEKYMEEHKKENAWFLHLRYEEIRGSLEFFEKMLKGLWDKDFIILRPGEEITQELFL